MAWTVTYGETTLKFHAMPKNRAVSADRVAWDGVTVCVLSKRGVLYSNAVRGNYYLLPRDRRALRLALLAGKLGAVDEKTVAIVNAEVEGKRTREERAYLAKCVRDDAARLGLELTPRQRRALDAAQLADGKNRT